jgi:hypothetical protein
MLPSQELFYINPFVLRTKSVFFFIQALKAFVDDWYLKTKCKILYYFKQIGFTFLNISLNPLAEVFNCFSKATGLQTAVLNPHGSHRELFDDSWGVYSDFH